MLAHNWHLHDFSHGAAVQMIGYVPECTDVQVLLIRVE